ncbi:MAG: DUF6600 domain-containing protein [Ginsengibacter sp.]
MKYLYIISFFLLMIVMSSCTTSRYYQSDQSDQTGQENSQDYSQQQQPQSEITYQQFYNDLSPYGNWVNYSSYGYAWIPNQSNFRPYYTNGQWVYTNYGWTWTSNYNWGWAPFHYGRWINDMMYGWMWIPGYEWAPAWVSWRGGGNYYGWAPLGPNMDANISAGSIPYNDWTFVPGRYMNSSRMNNYYVNPSNNVTIFNNTTIINNTTVVNNRNADNNGPRRYYNAGPAVNEVERSTGTSIRTLNLVESNKPAASQINNNTIRVFRPAVNQQPSNVNTAPQRVADLNQVRQMSPGNQPANRQNNQYNNNNERNSPVRQIPANQTPQVLRDEPPVRNNIPGVAPQRSNPPARILQNNNNNIQQQENNRNSQQPTNSEENPNRTNTPVRTFTPHSNNQNVNHAVQQQPKAPVNQNLNRGNNVPERQLQNNNPTPPKENLYKRNEIEINKQPVQQQAPVRTLPNAKDQ